MQIFVGLENCRDNWWDPYIGRRPNPLVGGWATHTQKMLSIRDRVSSYGWRLKKALKFQCTHTPLSGPASSLKMLRMHRLTFRFLDSYKYILYMMDIDMDMDIDIYIFIYIYIYILDIDVDMDIDIEMCIYTLRIYIYMWVWHISIRVSMHTMSDVCLWQVVSTSQNIRQLLDHRPRWVAIEISKCLCTCNAYVYRYIYIYVYVYVYIYIIYDYICTYIYVSKNVNTPSSSRIHSTMVTWGPHFKNPDENIQFTLW
jgi:hypothetical protein